MRDDIELAHGAVSRTIIAAYFHVYNNVDVGLSEAVYHRAMLIALAMRGLETRSEVLFDVVFESTVVGSYRADIVVERKFLVELKSVEKLVKVHEAQVYNYLRISKLPVALLMNFGDMPSFRRLVLPRRASPNR